jgi:hypothetical protein
LRWALAFPATLVWFVVALVWFVVALVWFVVALVWFFVLLSAILVPHNPSFRSFISSKLVRNYITEQVFVNRSWPPVTSERGSTRFGVRSSLPLGVG